MMSLSLTFAITSAIACLVLVTIMLRSRTLRH